MSQRDLIAELRDARVAAPAEVRERVRLLAASAPAPPRRRLTWRRALVVAVPAVAAVAAAVVLTRPAAQHPQPLVDRARVGAFAQHGAVLAPNVKALPSIAPQSAPGRVQRYGASLTLRVATADGVSNGVKRALAITASLGGHPTSVHASAQGRGASADLVLKIPRANVQAAIRELSALGTITAEQVDIQDLTEGLNATDRTIARLQAQLAALRGQPQTPAVVRQIAALTAQVQQLQRAEASTIRTAHFATVSLHLRTPPPPVVHRGSSRLHGLVVAVTWLGIGALYALALGVPVALVCLVLWVLVRALRRRREEELLSRP